MAQHKAPTAVSVAPIQEKSGLSLWISRHWLYGAILAIAIAAVIIVRYRIQQGAIAAQDTSWEKLTGALDRDQETGLMKGDPVALAALATDLKESVAGPAARLAEARVLEQDHEYDRALDALDALVREHPEHPFVKAEYVIGDSTMTLVDSMRKSIKDARAFEAAHPGLYKNPDPPADAPRVRLTTDQGAIVVALYSSVAPKHCENFLKLCREKFYDGTKFHRVVPKFMIQGGDPNSKTGEPATWGQGGPGYKLDPELSDLSHFAFTLAMAKSGGDTQSSGSQFYITTDPAHGLDGGYTVFGTVVEGKDVVKKIGAGAIAPNSDRPLVPAVLLSAEVL